MELPRNYVRLPWSNAEVGRTVWVCELKSGSPHAYGPYMVADKDARTLDDPSDLKRQPFEHKQDNLIVPFTMDDAIVELKDTLYAYTTSRVLADQNDASPHEKDDFRRSDAALTQAIERIITLIRGRTDD